MRSWQRWAPVLVVILLALQFTVAGLLQARGDSPTVDEAIDVSSGITNLARGDLRLAPEHGPLPLLASAVVASRADPVVPETEAHEQGDWLAHTHPFIRQNLEAETLRQVVFLGRLAPLATALLGALLLYRLGGRLAGPWGGVLAAGSWLTTPFVVGVAHLAVIDVPFTVATLGVVLSLVRLAERSTDARALAVGGSLVLALLTRHTALVLVAVAVGSVAWHHRRDWRVALRRVVVVAGVAWIGVWIGIRSFDPTPLDGPPADRLERIVSDARSHSLAADVALAIPWPLEYRGGLAYLVDTSGARPAYLWGQAWEGSRWWFFPASILTKVTLPVLAAVALGVVGWWRTGAARRVAPPVVAVAAALSAFLLAQPLNLGLRLALPVVALGFVAAAGVPLLLRGRAGRVALTALLVVQVGTFWQAHPHSLAWAQPPFQPAYRHLGDSSLDWGQDLHRFEDWVAAGDRTPFVSLFRPRGWIAPDAVRALRTARVEDVRGWVAVSATALTVVRRDELSWLRAYCPVDVIGETILLYRFDEAPDPSPGPVRPAAPCDGPVSTR